MGQNFTRFEVEFECYRKNVSANCGLEWTPIGGPVNVTHLGGIERGEFESNGDIAGIGILLSFAIPTGVMLFMAAVMWMGITLHLQETKTASHSIKPITRTANKFVPSPHGNRRRQGHAPFDPEAQKPFSETSYDFIESTLMALSDYQIVFAAAVCLHFVLIGKCNISMYHFNIGLNIITIALANTLVSLVFLRNFWKTPISSLARLVIFFVLLYFQGKILWTLAHRADTQGTVESRPWKPRRNSLIFLPAICFLDPDPLRKIIKLMNEPADQRAVREKFIGRLNPDQRWNYELNTWIVVTIIYGLVVLYQIFSGLIALRRWSHQRKVRNGGAKYREVTKKPTSRRWRWTSVFVCGFTYASCFVISILRLVHVFHVREWVLYSGWMKDQDHLGNPETNFASYGQVAALVTMAGFVIVGFDKLTWQAGIHG